MKKLISLIIAFILLTPYAPPTRAGVFDDCAFEDFGEGILEDLVEQYDAPAGIQSDLKFRVGFELARTKYHDYVKCIFNTSVANLLGSAAGTTDGIFGANAPNLPEWTKPESACLQQDKLVEILTDSGPENLLEPLLEVYNRYIVYINELLAEHKRNPGVDITNPDFGSAQDKSKVFELLVENEIQDSIVALDTAFIQLKEVRAALVMHVHFQCMLKNLEQYRRTLANLRSVVTVLPALIIDASITQ